MRFIVDAQLPPALARWLVERGHAAEHVSDRGLQSASDDEIWRLAFAEGATIVTKDADFQRRRALGSAGPCVVWVRWPNVRKRDLFAGLDQLMPQIESALERGERLIEIV